MRDARLERFWLRAGPVAAMSALALAASIEGCGGGDTTSSSSSTSGGDTTSSTSSMSNGSGGASTSSGTGGESSSSSGTGGSSMGLAAKLVANTGIVFDAAPDPEGFQVYIAAVGDNGPGVFKAPTDGSSLKPTEVKVGDPFADPFGIALSSDGKQIYITDPGADTPQQKGQIFTLPVIGGNPAPLSGTEETLPRAITVADENNKDVLYYSGTDPMNGAPTIFKVAASGGKATVVAAGDLLTEPNGIAVAKSGDVYVCDALAANVIVISGGKQAALLKDPIKTGSPCGVALSLDEKTLYVTALDPGTLTDVILVVDIAASKMATPFSTGLEKLSEIGGIHRSKNADLFSFVDSTGPASGTVWTLK